MRRGEDVLLALLANGEALAATYQQCKGADGGLDWDRFKAAATDGALIQNILGIGTAEIDAALAQVRAERAQLRARWRGEDMPDDVVDRLSALSDIGTELASAKLEVGLTPGYVKWMMETAKPVLERAKSGLVGRG